MEMSRVSQPDSAGLQLSPIEGMVIDGAIPQRLVGDDGLETVSGPHIIRPPSYASNRQSRNNTARTRRAELASLPPIPPTTPPTSNGTGAPNDVSTGIDASSSSEISEEAKPLLQAKKKHWGLTWRQWILVLAPSILIVAAAAIAAGVVVSKEKASSSSSSPSANSSTPAADTQPVSKSGAFGGTDIALAHPGLNNETLWMFYQDFEGDLSFVALDTQGLWHQKGKIDTEHGILNGSAITAINYPMDNPTKINLLYVDGTGQIRNKLYTNDTQSFQNGEIYQKVYTMPPNITTVRRMSWYADDDQLFYMYAGGTDGLMHEYTHTGGTTQWQPTSTFVSSNGYSGATVTPNKTLSMLHAVNADGNLQYWTREPPGSSGVPNSWTPGASSSQLPVTIYSNSTLQLDKGSGTKVVFQDTTGEVFSISLRGDGTDAQWNAPVSTGVTARLGTSVKSIQGDLYPGLNGATHFFMQLNGSDITHLVRNANSGQLSVLETPIE